MLPDVNIESQVMMIKDVGRDIPAKIGRLMYVVRKAEAVKLPGKKTSKPVRISQSPTPSKVYKPENTTTKNTMSKVIQATYG